MSSHRTHIVIPPQLVREIDSLVGKRHRSQFFVRAAAYELQRERQLAALRAATGCWKEEDHPELEDGSAAYVKKLRAENEQRFKKQTGRR